MDDRDFPKGWPWPKSTWGIVLAAIWVIGTIVILILRRKSF